MVILLCGDRCRIERLAELTVRQVRMSRARQTFTFRFAAHVRDVEREKTMIPNPALNRTAAGEPVLGSDGWVRRYRLPWRWAL